MRPSNGPRGGAPDRSGQAEKPPRRVFPLIIALSLGLLVPPALPAAASGEVPARESEANQVPPVPGAHMPLGVRAVVALQIALEAKGYSPGLLDGSSGPRTRTALAAFQSSAGIAPTGVADQTTLVALAVDLDAAFALRPIRSKDLEKVDPPPKDWLERSRKKRLLYPTLANLVAEEAHTTERFLAALNPGRDLAALAPGDALCVPAVKIRRASPAVDRLEIDLERKIILLFGQDRPAPAGILFCSIAADPAKAIPGETRIIKVAADPTYTFDPAKWPEVRGITKVLTIPPGPRSPVGIRWIGLERDGVGIHGSPEPEMIGKTGSHGCFRLTNWDAAWLAGIVQVGMPVKIRRSASEMGWSWEG